jgi:predicted acetyltransferase
MSVPGGLVPTAGVSWVSVLPSYRRRGVMTSLVRRQLQNIKDRGEPVAVLLPTESMLYGRYGYGMATRHASFTIRRGEGVLAADAPSDSAIRLRIAAPKECRDELEKVYGTVFRSRPGFVARSAAWWDRATRGPGGQTPLNCLLAEDAAGPRGYALYAVADRWDPSPWCTVAF